ncbi:MAG: DUF6702 family protein [Flavobacteriaceae bacterium]
MKTKIYSIVFVLFVALTSFTSLHKYYVSVTDVEFSKANKSLQITSRLFIDDLEKVLQERYDSTLKIDSKVVDLYIEKYFNKKLVVDVNGEKSVYTYIGKEFEDDMVHCYFEIENVEAIQTVKVTNQLLLDVFDGQQNITHVSVNNKKKSFLLIKEEPSGLLKL